MTEDGTLLLFPISKSTQLLMCNGSGFARFSQSTGVSYADLSTWEGFYDAAGEFYDWSGGEASSPALWLRAMWWSPISIPTRRS